MELDDIDDKRIIQMKMMEINDEVDELNMEEMTEDKLWGAQAFEDDDAFDYGRDVIKEGSLETRLRLPYKTMPLFTNPEWYSFNEKKEYIQMDGILRSGNPTGAYLKANLEIKDEGYASDDSMSFSDQEVEDKDKKKEEEHKEEDKEEEDKGNMWEIINHELEKVAEDMPF